MKPKNGSILREIEISKGYDTALLTTFNFEVSFFDRAVYPILIKGGIRNINLFIDARQLNEALSYAESGLFGRHYYVSPVNISGAFHPKVILLLGKNKAKLIVASANIKTTGYLINNEVFQTFEYTEKNREYASLIHDAVTFFKSLYMISENRDRTTLAVLENWQIGDYEPNTGVRFISNLSSSIISQISFLAEKMHGSRLRVAVPFYDQELSALEALDDIFNFGEINLYIQNQTSTFPVERGLSDEMYEKLILYPFRNINENSDSAAFYHGKVFEFINSNTCHILYGSPNCTVSALMNTYTAYIDSLFGYKTYDQLKLYFRKLYGSKISYAIADDVFNVEIHLKSETKAPMYLGNIHIETVLKSFVEAGVQINGINIVFYESTGKTVRYEIKTAGIKASTVSQIINAGGKTNRFKCRNKIDNIWRPVYF